MVRNEIISRLGGAQSQTLLSGTLIDAGAELAGWIKAALFGDSDDLHADIFDEGTEMALTLAFTPGQIEVSVPKLGGRAVGIAYGEFDEASLAALGQLVLRGD